MEDIGRILCWRSDDYEIGGRSYSIYPLTLAKTYYLSSFLGALDMERMMSSKCFERDVLLRVKSHRRECSMVLAIYGTENSRVALGDWASVCELASHLDRSLSDASMASLLLIALRGRNIEEVKRATGIDVELRKLAKVSEVKRSGNTLVFGGRTVLGSFIGPLKEMGYRDEEILFEIGLDYLQLMLADRVTSVYMSDDELEDVPTWAGGKLIDGDSDGGYEELLRVES